ncbi:YihY/virulence factor BrkB family protein [Enteractinococcus helveticum]|uniref:YihY/virulence factor BrkB family protein n=1 Tax=Enteractinococcus helveticum TaxID=1837282 RepID=UPI00082C8546|nr:YihY/virulence factor BrkB family protein [Enteractinococcus helveticum]
MSIHHKLERTIAAEQRALNDPQDRKPAKRLPGAAFKYAMIRAIKQFTVDKGTDRAAILTYFAVLSLAPLLLAVFSTMTLFLASAADQVENFAQDLVTQTVPAEYQDLALNLVTTMTQSVSGGVIALIIGTVVALWSASKYVQAFARNINEIYGVVEGRSKVKFYLTTLLITLIMVVTVVAALVSLALNKTIIDAVFAPIAQVFGAQEALTTLTESFLPIWEWVKYPVVLILLILMLGVLYHFSGNVERKFKPLSLGAIVAVIGIVLAGVAMIIYLTYFASYSSYGAIGTLMAILFVIWIFNIVILLGAEIDVEILRARQLVAGIPAEEHVQIRPRSVSTVEKQSEKHVESVEDGKVLRRSLSVVHRDNNDDDQADR